MKKILFILILSFVCSDAYSQARENRQNATVLFKGEALLQTSGWAYNETDGKWYENKNVLEPRTCSSSWVHHVTQNFIHFSFWKISHGSKNYIALIYERKSGSYKYPKIMKDWSDSKTYTFFIFTEDEYLNLKKTVALSNGQSIIIKSKLNGEMSDTYNSLGGENAYTEENLLARITKSISDPASNFYDKCFILNSQNVDGQNIVRFRLPDSCYRNEEHIKGTGYFELNLEDFKNILF